MKKSVLSLLITIVFSISTIVGTISIASGEVNASSDKLDNYLNSKIELMSDREEYRVQLCFDDVPENNIKNTNDIFTDDINIIYSNEMYPEVELWLNKTQIETAIASEKVLQIYYLSDKSEVGLFTKMSSKLQGKISVMSDTDVANIHLYMYHNQPRANRGVIEELFPDLIDKAEISSKAPVVYLELSKEQILKAAKSDKIRYMTYHLTSDDVFEIPTEKEFTFNGYGDNLTFSKENGSKFKENDNADIKIFANDGYEIDSVKVYVNDRECFYPRAKSLYGDTKAFVVSVICEGDIKVYATAKVVETTTTETEPTTSSTTVTEPTTESATSTTVTEPVTTEPVTQPVAKTTITLVKSSSNLYVKGTATIKATVKNAVGKTTYKSNNTKVAKVDSKGKVTALKKGTTKITVTNNKVSKTFTVTVKNPKLNKTSVTIAKGRTFTLKITGKVGKATFRSSNKKVVSVSNTGKVTAKKRGSATISVNTNGITLKCKVKVK